MSVFLRPLHELGSRIADAAGRLHWYRLHPHRIADLIARLTRPGDVVVDLDGHPTVTEHLVRQVPPHVGDSSRLRVGLRDRLILGPLGGVVLLTARLQRLTADPADLPGMTAPTQARRLVLSPAGFLLVALTLHRFEARSTSHRTVVITAARATGLLWHEELVVLGVFDQASDD